jgi:hypothetical protein
MRELSRLEIPTQWKGLHSLCWCGDDLVDYAGGLVRYHLDGTQENSRCSYSYRFDRAVGSPDGEYAVLHELLGTKGLILKNDSVVREINRSFYHADDYEYPIALFKWVDGRTVIAHCPDEYCRLEIEDIETGEKMVSRTSKSVDFFHSRLQVSPKSSYLLSAGWIWHPFDAVLVYEIAAAVQRPEILDEGWKDFTGDAPEEVSTATFLDDSRIILAGQDDTTDESIPTMAVYDLKSKTMSPKIKLQEPLGTFMALGDYLVGFFEHPKLIDIRTGQIVQKWTDIESGNQHGSILRGAAIPPQIALDPQNKRFAVGTKEKIIVVQLG